MNRSGAKYQRARDMYDEAFRRWSNAVCAGRDDGRAERLYRRQRDALAAVVLGCGAGPQSAAVERLAYSLWQRAGRPWGTADSDWYRAEAFFSSLCLCGTEATRSRRDWR